MENKMRNLYILVIILLISLSFAKEASAMRCNGKIIDVGDTTYKLLKACGQPDAKLIDDWGSRVTYIYNKNGREQRILTIDNIVKGGV